MLITRLKSRGRGKVLSPSAVLGQTHTGLHDLPRQGKEEMASVYLSFSCSHPFPSLSPFSPFPTLTVTHGGCKDTWGALIRVKSDLQGGVINVSCPPLSLGPLSFLPGRTGMHKKGATGEADKKEWRLHA